MSEQLKNWIGYFKDCYEAERSSSGVFNVFSSKVENLHFFDDEELLASKRFVKVLIPRKLADVVQKKKLLSDGDYQLFYGVHLVLGCVQENDHFKKGSFATPLLLYPAIISESDGDFYLELTSDFPELNISALRDLNFKTDFIQFRQDLEGLLSSEVGVSFTLGLEKCFQKHLHQVDTKELLFSPKISSGKDIRKQKSSIGNQEETKILPAAFCFLTDMTLMLGGVELELQKLLDSDMFSEPLKIYLSDNGVVKADDKPDELLIDIPIVLSESQRDIIQASNRFPLSVLIGPPGTGKTFSALALAMENLLQGKKVLYATQSTSALEVFYEKALGYGLDNHCIFLKDTYVRETQGKINHWIRQVSTNSRKSQTGDDLETWLDLQKEVKQQSRAIKSVVSSLKRKSRVLDEQGISAFLHQKIIQWFHRLEEKEWKQMLEYTSTLDKFIKVGKLAFGQHLTECVLEEVAENFQTLVGIRESIRLGTFNIDNIQESHPFLLQKIFPLWIVKINQASKLLPLTLNSFDLLIIDEATQCDMASTIPLMQRAKRVVVTGDPKQIRHFSFLSRDENASFRIKYGIDEYVSYRDQSLLDRVISRLEYPAQMVHLKEHFRSLEGIIEFSNAEFYDNELIPMKSLPHQREQPVVDRIAIHGQQSKSGVNHDEAEEIIKILKNGDFEGITIGVLSPFRKQSDYLRKKLQNTLDKGFMLKHKLKVATPYGFQGSERDVMILSIAMDDGYSAAARNYLERPDIFNVMITRAAKRQIVLYSVTPNKLPNDSLLRKFLTKSNISMVAQPVLHQIWKDEMLNEVRDFIENKYSQIHVYTNYQISDIRIDLLVRNGNRYIGIDLIGQKGDFGKCLGISRVQLLHRIGLPIFTLSLVSWQTRSEESKSMLTKVLQSYLI